MDVRDTKMVGYFLNPISERAEKVLINGEPGGGEYFDEVDVEIEDGKFEYGDQTRKIKEKGCFVDGDHLNVYWKHSEGEPMSYEGPNKFSATDLKILRSEETTRKGIEGAMPEGGAFGTTRWKPIVVFAVIFGIIGLVLFVLPSIFPSLRAIPIF